MSQTLTYREALRGAQIHLLENHADVFIIGQGLWSPWYVGGTMEGLEARFGHDRIIDSPISEGAVTGAAIGAALSGLRPIVVHPRMDFMMLALDQIVNQAAKWSHMLGGATAPGITIRGIINRGGEQGAQHSQSLQSWFAHVPGLRVVAPHCPQAVWDLLIAAVLSPDPVIFIDDRWLYDLAGPVVQRQPVPLSQARNRIIRHGRDVTLCGSGWGTELALQAADLLAADGIAAEVVDLPILNPFDKAPLISSVTRTGRLIAVDPGWATCGLSAEIIACASEAVPLQAWKSPPARITLPFAPAPSARSLEQAYYPTPRMIAEHVHSLLRHAGPARPRNDARLAVAGRAGD